MYIKFLVLCRLPIRFPPSPQPFKTSQFFTNISHQITPRPSQLSQSPANTPHQLNPVQTNSRHHVKVFKTSSSIHKIFANTEKGLSLFTSRFAADSLIYSLMEPGITKLTHRVLLRTKQTRLRCGSRIPYLTIRRPMTL